MMMSSILNQVDNSCTNPGTHKLSVKDLINSCNTENLIDSKFTDDVLCTVISLFNYSLQFNSEYQIKFTISEIHILLGLFSKIQRSLYSESAKRVVLIISYNGFLDAVKSYLSILAEEGIYSSVYNWNIFFSNLLSYFNYLAEYQNLFKSKLKKYTKKLEYSLFLTKELLNVLKKHKHIICTPSLFDDANKLLETYLEYNEKTVNNPEFNLLWNPYPTAEEINEHCLYRLDFEPYNTFQNYLKYQFLLLKEDYLCTIREGLKLYREAVSKTKWEKNYNIYVYESVLFLDYVFDTTSHKEIGYQIRIGNDKCLDWAKKKSKQLLFGSLLLFSQDNFDSFLIGLVSDRKNLEHGGNVVHITLINHDDNNMLNSYFTMIEPAIFFEPYHQVLDCLKTLSMHSHSMSNYILSKDLDYSRPRYLKSSFVYNIFEHKINVCRLKSWPTALEMGLDNFQLKALKFCLTNQFTLIQGPPGTGKTYLGLKIVEILIKNESIWNCPISPILVVCYTNHALDQFLEGTLSVTNKIVRIGGQSKSKVLIPYNLRLLHKKPFKKANGVSNLRSNVKKMIGSCVNRIQAYKKSVFLISQNIGVLSFNILRSVMTDEQLLYFNSADAFLCWLFGENNDIHCCARINSETIHDLNKQKKNFYSVTPKYMKFKEDLEIANKVLSYQINFCDLEIKLMKLSEQIENKRVCNLKPVEIKTLIANISEYISELSTYKKLVKYMNYSLQAIEIPSEGTLDKDLSLLELSERWKLYFQWQKQVTLRMNDEFNDAIIEQNNLCEYFRDVCNIEDYSNIKYFGARVIGVTTTGAARYNMLLSTLKPKIVIVEEAAEILEAHTVTSLIRTCQHVIMIGDHYQLRPSTASYEFAKQFELDKSLFERLVKKGLPVHTLSTQRRMRPEICSLVTPLIYKRLENHPVVLEYPNVKGVKRNLFFINHNVYEEEVPDSLSHKNKKEADFLLSFCCYLIRQGYDQTEITILTTYLAQENYMISKKNADKLLRDVRISVIDNYQGEENVIILLSLVRSNSANKIGYLASRNRVCVALTRAKYGLYIVGNMDCLKDSSSLWMKLYDSLVHNNSYGNELELVCQTHGNIFLTSPTSDFSKIRYGGCNEICNTILPCGHICNKPCHGKNIDHKTYKCPEKCKRFCVRGHLCKLYCFEDCKMCDDCHNDKKSDEYISSKKQKNEDQNSNSECDFEDHLSLTTMFNKCSINKADIMINSNLSDSINVKNEIESEQILSLNLKQSDSNEDSGGESFADQSVKESLNNSNSVCEESEEISWLDIVNGSNSKKEMSMDDKNQNKEDDITCDNLKRFIESKGEKNDQGKCLEQSNNNYYFNDIDNNFVDLMSKENPKASAITESMNGFNQSNNKIVKESVETLNQQYPVLFMKLNHHNNSLLSNQELNQSDLREFFPSLNISSFEISDKISIEKGVTTSPNDEHLYYENLPNQCQNGEEIFNDLNKDKSNILAEDSKFLGSEVEKLVSDSYSQNKDDSDAQTEVELELSNKRIDDPLIDSEIRYESNVNENMYDDESNLLLRQCDPLSPGVCNFVLPCGHRCLRKCGNETCLTKKCYKTIKINLPCNHINEVKCFMSLNCFPGNVTTEILLDRCEADCKELLECGHVCQGTCSSCYQGRLHQRCSQICGKILLCGHKCTMYCWEDIHKCVNICSNKCVHKECSSKCGEKCDICVEKCDWQCEHFSCTMPCGEICNRPLCMLPCRLILPCNHPCTGFCGEPCPPICLQCQPLEPYNHHIHRFFVLEECGHYFEWSYFIDSLKLNEISLKRCPSCGVSLWRTLRIKNLILINNREIQKIMRSEMPGRIFTSTMIIKIIENLQFLKENISEEVLCNSNFQNLLQFTVDNIGLILNGAESADERITLKSLLFIQIYLKEMSNLTSTYDMFSMKSSHRRLIFLRMNLLLQHMYETKYVASLNFIRFELESLKIYRTAVFFILNKEYLLNKGRYNSKKVVDDLFLRGFNHVNSIKAYDFSQDLDFFNILSDLVKLIGSTLPIINTDIFKMSLKSSLLPMFKSRKYHEGEWSVCLNGHAHESSVAFDSSCDLCN